MLTAYSADRVRAAEAVLMATVPEGELMRRAALGLAQVCRARLAECRGSSVVALVGPGNNGGDALYAVAHLAGDGFDCVVLHGDWEVHQGGLGAARAAGVRVLDPSEHLDELSWPHVGADPDGELGVPLDPVGRL